MNFLDQLPPMDNRNIFNPTVGKVEGIWQRVSGDWNSRFPDKILEVNDKRTR